VIPAVSKVVPVKAATAAGGFTVELPVFAAKTYLEGKIKGLIGG
jgi:hypothetical protein